MISFPLEDIHVVNEHHAVQKSHDATHKKNVLTWCLSMYGLKQTRDIKNVFLKAAKNCWCRSLLGRVIHLNLLLAAQPVAGRNREGGGGGLFSAIICLDSTS